MDKTHDTAVNRLHYLNGVFYYTTEFSQDSNIRPIADYCHMLGILFLQIGNSIITTTKVPKQLVDMLTNENDYGMCLTEIYMNHTLVLKPMSAGNSEIMLPLDDFKMVYGCEDSYKELLMHVNLPLDTDIIYMTSKAANCQVLMSDLGLLTRRKLVRAKYETNCIFEPAKFLCWYPVMLGGANQ